MNDKICTFELSLIAIILLIISHTASATERIKGPEGENILAMELITEGNTHIRLIISSQMLFSARLTGTGKWSANKLLFEEKNGSIQGFTVVRNDTGNIRSIYVVNSKNKLYKFKYNIALDFLQSQYDTMDGPSLANGLKQLLVLDKIYLMAYNANTNMPNIFVSRDDGKSWYIDNIFTKTGSNFNVREMFFDSLNNFIVLSLQYIFIRPIDKDTFNLIDLKSAQFPSTFFIDRKNAIHISANKKPHLFTTDYGIIWQTDTIGLSGTSIKNFAEDSSGTLYAYGSNKLFAKADSNSNWKLCSQEIISILNSANSVNDLKAGRTLEIALPFGIFSSSDKGNSWNSSTDGVPACKFYGLQFTSDSKALASTGLGIFQLNPTDSSWVKTEPKNGYLSGRLLYKDLIGNYYYPGNSTGKSYNPFVVSSDGGINWNIDSAGIYRVPNHSGQVMSTVFIDEKGGQHIAIGKTNTSNTIGALVFSKLKQGNWVIDTTGLSLPFAGGNDSITINLFSSDKKGNLYFSTSQIVGGNSMFVTNVLFKRPISGGTWQKEVTEPILNNFTGIAADKSGGFFISTSSNTPEGSNIYYKTSKTWEKISTPPPSAIDAKFIALDSSGIVYVVYANRYTNRGIYSTSDRGKTWLFAGLDNVQVNGLTAEGNNMFAYTDNGIYILSSRAVKFPKTTVKPKYIEFGTLPVNQIRDTTIILTNTGEDTLRVSSFTSNANEIKFLNTIKYLAPGKSDSLKIRYLPSSIGKYKPQVLIQSNDYNLTVSIDVNVILPPDPPVIKLNPKYIDFKDVDIYSGKDTIVTITNIGKDTLFVKDVSVSNTKFNIQKKVFNILSGDSTTFKITFYPNDTSFQKGLIIFMGKFLPDTIYVSGKGVIKPYIPPYTIKPNIINFGKLQIGNSKDTIIEITANNDYDVTIDMILLYTGFFNIYPNHLNIYAGETLELKVTFSPPYEGLVRERASIVPSTRDSLILIGEGIKKSGIEDNSHETQPNLKYIVSPNPVGAMLNLKFINTSSYSSDDSQSSDECFKSDIPCNCRISIFNILGILMKSENIQLSYGESQVQIETGLFNPGVYFISMDANGKREFLKFEKVE
ncbi:MAG: type sorting protein [Ignavibacteria bacterium]|nr:type sorting protein [Ignavibacteria bacterium]